MRILSSHKQCFRLAVLVLFTTTPSIALSGRNVEVRFDELLVRGEISEGVPYSLHLERALGGDGRLTHFDLELKKRKVIAPLAALRELPDPHLEGLEIVHSIPGFMGVISKSIDPTADVRESIHVVLPYGEPQSCENPEDRSDVREIFGRFELRYSLQGELLSKGRLSACEACTADGLTCLGELDTEKAGGAGSN
jgi:hypothetical protein